MELSSAMLGVLMGLLISSPFLFARLSGHPLRAAGLVHSARISDEEVELYLRTLFRSLGYKLAEPKDAADRFFDFIITDGLGQRRGVLSRFLREWVSALTVDEAIGASLETGSEGPVIISLKGFSRQARVSAAGTRAVLWGATDLAAAVKRLSLIHTAEMSGWTGMVIVAEERPVTVSAEAPSAYADESRTRHIGDQLYSQALKEQEPERPKCPRCGKTMVVRRGTGGDYWSCAVFPRCLGTRPKEGKAPYRARDIAPEPHHTVAASALSGD